MLVVEEEQEDWKPFRSALDSVSSLQRAQRMDAFSGVEQIV